VLHQRCSCATPPVLSVNIQHVNTAVVVKGVVQHSVADNFFIGDGDKASAGSDFTTDKLSALFFLARDQVERAKSPNVAFDG
jgi:hypothetical protein